MNSSTRIARFTLALLALCALAACSYGPPTAGKATPFVTACSRDNDGQRVAVEGYLYFPASFTEARSVMLLLHESDAFYSPPIGVQMPFGTGLNQVEEVSDGFTDEDLQVHLADGTVAGFGTRVTISGTVYFPIVEQQFPCGLENPLVELADKTAGTT